MQYKDILNHKMKELENLSFQDLSKYANNSEPIIFEIDTEIKKWQIEINIFYEDEAKNSIMAIGSIDDGGIRAMFFPYSKSFHKSHFQIPIK